MKRAGASPLRPVLQAIAGITRPRSPAMAMVVTIAAVHVVVVMPGAGRGQARGGDGGKGHGGGQGGEDGLHGSPHCESVAVHHVVQWLKRFRRSGCATRTPIRVKSSHSRRRSWRGRGMTATLQIGEAGDRLDRFSRWFALYDRRRGFTSTHPRRIGSGSASVAIPPRGQAGRLSSVVHLAPPRLTASPEFVSCVAARIAVSPPRATPSQRGAAHLQGWETQCRRRFRPPRRPGRPCAPRDRNSLQARAQNAQAGARKPFPTPSLDARTGRSPARRACRSASTGCARCWKFRTAI